MSFLGSIGNVIKGVGGAVGGFLGGPLGGALIGGIGSLLGGHQQASGAKDAARLQMDQFNTLNQQQQPFIKSGYDANAQLRSLLGLGENTGQAGFGSLNKPFGADEFKQFLDPGYQFRKQQGEQGVLNSASAGSGAMSGAALKDLLSFNQDLASTEYGNAFNRYQTQQGNIFQRLAGLTNLGQNAAAGVGQQGTALATGAGQSLTNAGTATGAGTIGAANAVGNTLSSNYWLGQVLNQNKGP